MNVDAELYSEALSVLLVAALVGRRLAVSMLAVEIPSCCPNSTASACSATRIARHRPNYGASGGTHGTAAQGPLLGLRHPRASGKREAEHENGYRHGERVVKADADHLSLTSTFWIFPVNANGARSK